MESTADLVDGRTAFELCLIQQRKDRSRITGVAVDNDGLRFYVGLDSGFVEEHRVVYGPSGCVARVCARRQASKKAVKNVCLLGGAGILAVLIDDGQLLLCDLDQLEPVPLTSAQNVTMVVGDPRYVSPCRFAIGVRSGLRRSRVDVYEVSREWEAQPVLLSQHYVPEEISGLAWLGEQIVVASRSSYYTVQSDQLRAILTPSVGTTFVALPIPNLLALLWEDSLGVVSDATGAAARPPLIFDSKPLLLTQGGMCIVSVSSDGHIGIYDQKTSRLVQRIPLDLKTFLMSGEETVTLHHADTPSGSTILLASVQCVWMLRPVAHEAQTIQLLKSGNIEAALELAENCIAESWAEDVFAQAGLLLLQERQWKFALECFERCSTAVFQPSQLFPLFPRHTRRWSDQVCLKSYWGLHNELSDLKYITGYLPRTESDRSDFESGTPIRDVSEETVAQNAVAGYLLKARQWQNVHCLEGVDTLITCLLSSVSNVGELERFVQTDHQADLEEACALLLKQRQFVSLSLLHWKNGQFGKALEILKELTFRSCLEAKAKSGSVRQANGKQERVGTYYTSHILATSAVNKQLTEQHLRWLVDVSPAKFLYVCQHSSLSPSVVLNLIPDTNLNLHFRYLHHLVHTGENPSQDGLYHTKLARSLCTMLQPYSEFERDGRKLPFMLASDDNYYQYPDAELSQSQRNILHFDTCLKPRLLVRQAEIPRAFFESEELNLFSGQELRDILQHHLLLSKGYDAFDIVQRIEGTSLHEEQVILYCRRQDHIKALRKLAIVLRDIHSAIRLHTSTTAVCREAVSRNLSRYCRLYGGCEGFIKLLDLLLNPGEGEEPFLSDAVQVLNAEGGNLDPMRVMDTLSETMPLNVAYPTLARMLRERTHRKRQTRITYSMQKLQNVAYRAEKCELESGLAGRVYVDVDTECALCRKPLGGRIFYKYPSGATVCGMCQKERLSQS